MNSCVNAMMDSDLRGAYSDAYIPAMNIATRLDEAMTIRGFESQSALARAAEVPQPTINRILKGVTPNPDLQNVKKLAQALSVNVEWLTDGVGPGPNSPKSAQKVPLSKEKGNVKVWDTPEDLEPDEDRIWIDRFDYHFSAGTGLIQWEVREKRALPFNAAFFKAKGVNPKDCKLCVSRGDSMVPYLFDRDVFMVHTASTRIRDGSVFAFLLNDEPLVKQIFKQPDGGLVLHSYNSSYPDKIVTPEMLEFIHVVGEVIYRSG
jgi:transcriptional regulator with XRE-family HTH domain